MANVKTYYGTMRAPRRAKADTDAYHADRIKAWADLPALSKEQREAHDAFKRELERAKAVADNPHAGDYERTIAGANLMVAKTAHINALEALWGAVALVRRSSHPFDRRLHGG